MVWEIVNHYNKPSIRYSPLSSASKQKTPVFDGFKIPACRNPASKTLGYKTSSTISSTVLPKPRGASATRAAAAAAAAAPSSYQSFTAPPKNHPAALAPGGSTHYGLDSNAKHIVSASASPEIIPMMFFKASESFDITPGSTWWILWLNNTNHSQFNNFNNNNNNNFNNNRKNDQKSQTY